MPRSSLAEAKRDLGAFSELIGQPLAPFQVGSLRLEREVTAIVAPRQTGKSRSLAVLALHRAFRRPGQLVLIVSAGEQAARRLLEEVAAMAVASPVLAPSVIDEQSALITLTNASQIRSVPASARQVRGWSVDLLLVDEAAFVDDDLLTSAALPTVAARPDARVVLASSPLGTTGAFYRYARQGLIGSDRVAAFRWSLRDAPWVTAEREATLREGLSEAKARAELDAEFLDATDDLRLIDREWVEAAHRLELPDQNGAHAPNRVGLDVARFGNDRTVAYVLRAGRARAGRLPTRAATRWPPSAACTACSAS